MYNSDLDNQKRLAVTEKLAKDYEDRRLEEAIHLVKVAGDKVINFPSATTGDLAQLAVLLEIRDLLSSIDANARHPERD